MGRPKWLEVLTDEEVRQVHWSSLEILEQTGVRIPHRQLLELMRDHGAFVDFAASVVKFPTALVENALKQAPSRFTWHGRSPAYDIRLGEDRVYYLGASTMVTVYDLVDYVSFGSEIAVRAWSIRPKGGENLCVPRGSMRYRDVFCVACEWRVL